jgi:hypothetical protein
VSVALHTSWELGGGRHGTVLARVVDLVTVYIDIHLYSVGSSPLHRQPSMQGVAMDTGVLRRVLGRAYGRHELRISFDDHTGEVCDSDCRSRCLRDRLRARLALHGLHH